jgi:hypothetical protein
MNLNVNEVLCFMKNKSNILPIEIINQLCTDFYSDSETDDAKKLLYETAFLHLSADDRPRMVKRRDQLKRQSDMDDMLKIFVSLDAEHIPMFVAADLAKIPPLGPKNFDLSSIIKDVNALKEQMCVLKYTQAGPTSIAVAAPLPHAEDRSPSPSQDTFPKTIDAQDKESDSDSSDSESECSNGDCDADSSDISSAHDEEEALQRMIQITKQRRERRPRRLQTSHTANVVQKMQPPPPKLQALQPSRHNRSYSSVAIPETARRTNRNGAITGNGKGFALKAASRGPQKQQNRRVRSTTGIFVTRLSRATRFKDVANHVRHETGKTCRCETLTTRYDSYRSFVIRCPPNVRQSLLQPRAWPGGVLAREFQE